MDVGGGELLARRDPFEHVAGVVVEPAQLGVAFPQCRGLRRRRGGLLHDLRAHVHHGRHRGPGDDPAQADHRQGRREIEVLDQLRHRVDTRDRGHRPAHEDVHPIATQVSTTAPRRNNNTALSDPTPIRVSAPIQACPS